MSAQQPKYLAIATDLRTKITAGDYQPGTHLPAIPELMRVYDCANETVRNALKVLTQEGRVVSRRGIGTVVRDDRPVTLSHTAGALPAPWAEQTGGTSRDDITEAGWTPALSHIAERLDIAPETLVFRRVRHLRLGEAEDLVTVLEQWIRGDVATAVISSGTDLATEVGNIYTLADTVGFRTARVRETVAARPADIDELDLFALPDGAALLTTVRTSLDADGHPLETATVKSAGDRMTITFEVAVTL